MARGGGGLHSGSVAAWCDGGLRMMTAKWPWRACVIERVFSG